MYRQVMINALECIKRLDDGIDSLQTSTNRSACVDDVDVFAVCKELEESIAIESIKSCSANKNV